jgi:biopolymer transport protein ExbD
MAMTMGGGGGYSSDINVTPMIDILLVLLIIFMVIVPVTPKGLNALVPQPPKHPEQQNKENERTIVVQIFPTMSGECATSASSAPPCYKINESSVLNGVGGQAGKTELLSRLNDIYANRAERIMFVNVEEKYAAKLDFHYVAEVIDIGRAASVDNIGLMTPKVIQQSQ